MSEDLATVRFSTRDIRLAAEAEGALIRGDRKVLRNPSDMPLAVLQRLGYLFLRPAPPVGPWPPAEIVAILKEFKARGLAEASGAIDTLPQLFERVLAVHVEHARRAAEALEQLRARQRQGLAVAAGGGRSRPAWREFEVDVIRLAQMYGWRVHHQRPARRANGGWTSAVEGNPGFPDLVLARAARNGRPGRFIVAELKAGGSVEPEQRAWRDTLVQVPGLEVHLWHEGNLEEIAGVLA